MCHRSIVDEVNYLLGHTTIICSFFRGKFKIVSICKNYEIIAHKLSDALLERVYIYADNVEKVQSFVGTPDVTFHVAEAALPIII